MSGGALAHNQMYFVQCIQVDGSITGGEGAKAQTKIFGIQKLRILVFLFLGRHRCLRHKNEHA